MMRSQPKDDDTLFQVDYRTTAYVDSNPIGDRQTATFARNWLEACDMVRKQFGAGAAESINVTAVYMYERLSSGGKVAKYFFNTYGLKSEANVPSAQILT